MRLLIFEPSYRRVAADLGALGSGLDLLVMDKDGVIRRGDAEVSLDDAAPEAGWANADVFFSPAARPYMTALLKSPALGWVQSGAAGYDQPVFGEFVKKGATLTTSHGQAVGMADYVLWGVLDAFQGGPGRRAAQAAHRWERAPFREIAGTRWVIVGFGAIGEGVAVRARAFGAHVTGVRRNTAPHPSADAMAPPSELTSLAAQADVLVFACPLTPETRHMGNAALFGALKPGAVFVNVGRGGLVDEPALLAALERGVPEHAVLDVFETEPLPAESAFWDHPRVTLTPHSSGMSGGNSARNDALFLENLRRRLAGKALENVADPKDVLAG